MMKELQIILADLTPKMIAAWEAFFGQEHAVQIVETDITTIDCDAIVSPANSFGFMDHYFRMDKDYLPMNTIFATAFSV